ncbi:TnsA endonuclease N-terminal domain-containing protein [Geomonas limicola]|uniref:TnsA endonuclease N-terminal domain-containing protein n=1 Tax=Geomonas limicola TaxID=2740186 RepID=UPI0016092493|nr:TnsA endonuclease N-terminal domain-containing protein [Geomonas limicola]
MKKRRDVTEKDVLRWLRQGYGQGAGRLYRPFFYVRDVPSRGRSSMFNGLITGRTHHYLSDLESACHVLVEYERGVKDIREQFALLPWEETQEIAEAFGLRHPRYPGTKTPIVMTSDLVVTQKKEGLSVISVKPFSKVDQANPKNRRTNEKLFIEKVYWQRRNIQWSLVTEREIPLVRAKNLNNLRMHIAAAEKDHLNAKMENFLMEFNLIWRGDLSLLCVLRGVSKRTRLSTDDCFCLFGRAVWLRLLNVNLNSHVLHHDLPVQRGNV